MKTFIKSEWLRVSRDNSCQICGKTDWCTYTSDGLTSCCMRAQSETPSKNGGWIHKHGEPKRIYIHTKKQEFITVDCPSIFQNWVRHTEPRKLMAFSESLGVEPMALHLIGCAWSPENDAWAFPMKDGFGKIIGIRLRNEKGAKWAVKGSRAGIFLPYDHDAKNPLLICEGPTDTAAALTLGFSAIGRPSCMGNEQMINDFIRITKLTEAVILSDNDTAGRTGSFRLQSMLKIKSIVLTLPCKDVRQFISIGGTKEMMSALFRTKVWINPKNS